MQSENLPFFFTLSSPDIPMIFHDVQIYGYINMVNATFFPAKTVKQRFTLRKPNITLLTIPAFLTSPNKDRTHCV